MACRFEVPVPGEGTDLFERVRREVEAHGGTVEVTADTIHVNVPTPLGPVRATARLVAPDRVAIEIVRKPMMVTCGMVRDRLGAFLAQGGRHGNGSSSGDATTPSR